MLRLALATLASAKSSPDLLETFTATDNDNRCRPPHSADVIESPSFVLLTVHGIDDGKRRFPQQIVAETALGHQAATAAARRRGLSIEAFLAERYGAPLSPRQYGEHVATLLTDARYATGVAYGVKGDVGMTALDG